MTRATPRPWEVVERNDCIEIRSADILLLRIPKVSGFDLHEARANAEVIVRAVNSYDAMLEACQLAFDCLDRKSRTRQPWTGRDQRAFEKLQDALILSVNP